MAQELAVIVRHLSRTAFLEIARDEIGLLQNGLVLFTVVLGYRSQQACHPGDVGGRFIAGALREEAHPGLLAINVNKDIKTGDLSDRGMTFLDQNRSETQDEVDTAFDLHAHLGSLARMSIVAPSLMEAILGTDSRSAVSHLHEIYRRLRRTRKSRSPAFALVKREARWVREIYRASRKYSQERDDVASSFQVSRLRQMIDAARFSFSEKIDLASYYRFSFFLSGNWKRRADYIHHQEMWLLLKRLNAAISSNDTKDLKDKRRFAARIEKANLPGIPIIGSFEDGITLLEPGEDDVGKDDLFSKPVDAWCGEGAFRWTARAGGYAGPDGAHMTLPQLAEALRLVSKGGSIILQRCITNHPALRPVSGRGLSTCRIITIKYPGARPQPALAVYRMPRGALIADNFAAGGLAAPVDLARGTLGVARCKSRPFVPVKEHPDSGHPIEGSTVPFWQSALDLALSAHREFREMPSVGWDIAITEHGPVLVEGNGGWGVEMVQIAHQRPLSDTAVPDCLLAHFAVANIPALARR